jgi:hypothetical protein
MLRIVLLMTVFLSSGMMAYALNNSDMIQLNLRMSRQQEQPLDLEQALQPLEQARLRQQRYEEEQMGRQQQEQVEREHYQQQLLWEWQRQKDARRVVDRELRDTLMQREQSRLFQ